MREFKNIQIPSTEEITIYPYRTIIGKLLFLANMTRLDIAYAVGYLARHQINSRRIHHKMISHLLSYLACHKKLGLIYRKRTNCTPRALELFSDADFGADQRQGDQPQVLYLGYITQ